MQASVMGLQGSRWNIKKKLINISKFQVNIYAAYTNSVRLINDSKFLVIYM